MTSPLIHSTHFLSPQNVGSAALFYTVPKAGSDHHQHSTTVNLKASNAGTQITIPNFSAYHGASYITKQLTTQKNENFYLELALRRKVKNDAGTVITNPIRFLNMCAFCSSLSNVLHSIRGKSFISSPKLPDLLWGPASLFYNGHRRPFPWG